MLELPDMLVLIAPSSSMSLITAYNFKFIFAYNFPCKQDFILRFLNVRYSKYMIYTRETL